MIITLTRENRDLRSLPCQVIPFCGYALHNARFSQRRRMSKLASVNSTDAGHIVHDLPYGLTSLLTTSLIIFGITNFAFIRTPQIQYRIRPGRAFVRDRY